MLFLLSVTVYLLPIFLSSLLWILCIPKSIGEAMANQNWQQAMLVDMVALDANNTWELISLPTNK